MIELRLPDPEAVRGLWATVWSYLTTPFRSLAPEGLAELLLVATIATVVALVLRVPYARRLVFVALLGLWLALLASLALTLARR